MSTQVDLQEEWFWWLCEKARGNPNLRGLSVEHAVALSYELCVLNIHPEPVPPAPELSARERALVEAAYDYLELSTFKEDRLGYCRECRGEGEHLDNCRYYLAREAVYQAIDTLKAYAPDADGQAGAGD